MAKEFKKRYVELMKSQFKNADKITCRTMVKTMECDLLLNGGK